MLELVRRHLIDHLPAGMADEVTADRIVSLDAARGVVDGFCFIVLDRGGAPRLVAKAARTQAGGAVFRTEHRTLSALDAGGINRDGGVVPRPLGLWEEGDTLITVQTALGGRLLKNEPGSAFFSERHLDATLAGVIAWYERFLESCSVPQVEITSEVYTREITEPVQRFLLRFRNPESERRFLEQRLIEERGLAGLLLPMPPRHGDFCTANMVLQPHGLGVFDWEFPLEPRLPLFDLFFFLSSTRFPFGGLRGESSHFKSFATVWWEDRYFSRAAKRVIRECAERHGIPLDALPDLFLVALVHVANMKYDAMLEAIDAREEASSQPVNDAQRERRWATLPRADKDVPFACIREGRFENLRLVVEHGLPAL